MRVLIAISLFVMLAGIVTRPVADNVSRSKPRQKGTPNIIVILADDLGYGDPACFNPRFKIATPNLDRMATNGLRLLDAHAPGP